jgi:hypothetical protein
MHVVGELQIRHPDDRAPVERFFAVLYFIVDLMQLTAMLVFAAQLTRAFPNTFLDTEFWSPSNYALSLLVQLKTANCSVVVDASDTTGFAGLTTTVTSANAPVLLALHTDNLRVAFAVCCVAFVASFVNRALMRQNVFFVSILGPKLRVHKDVLTVLDVALELGGLVLAQGVGNSGRMLQQYLRGCGMRSEGSVAFVLPTALFVSAGSAVAVHGIALATAIIVGVTFDRRAEGRAPAAGEPTAAAVAGDGGATAAGMAQAPVRAGAASAAGAPLGQRQ